MNQTKLFITTLPDGFHVEGPTQVVEGDKVELMCGASKYNYTDNSLVWYKQVESEYVEVSNTENNIEIVDVHPSLFDVGKRLRFDSVRPEDAGVYACRAVIQGPSKRHNLMIMDETIVERQMELTVDKMEIPAFVDTFNMNNGVLYVKEDGETVEMKCRVKGVPQPEVSWYLNNTSIDFSADINFQLFDEGQSLRIATVLAKKNEGTYTCKASSRAGVAHLEQKIVKVEAPRIYETNMAGSHQIIDTGFQINVDQGRDFNLTCRAHGNPRPVITWMRNRKLISSTRVMMADNRETLIVENAGPDDQGRYECIASNIGGSITRYQLVVITSPEQQSSSLYNSKLALPIYIAVGVAIIIAIFVLIGVKFCCKPNIKSPGSGTPPTPRLTQYEQPDHDSESCRLTRDSPPPLSSPCHACQPQHHQSCQSCHHQYPYSLYGCSLSQLSSPTSPEPGIPAQIMGSSLVGVRSCYSPANNYDQHSNYCTTIPTNLTIPTIPTNLTDFTSSYAGAGVGQNTASYAGLSSQNNLATSYASHYNHTLPTRMETLNREITKRLQERQAEAAPAATPPLTAEF